MNMIKNIFTPLTCAAVLTAATLSAGAQSQLLQSWDFTAADPGLNPTQVDGSVPGGPSFAVGGSGQLTTGSTLHISPTEALNSHIEVSDILLAPGFDTFRVEFEIGGWDWTNARNADQTRRLSLGFAGTFTDGLPNNNFTFAGGGSVRMNADGEIYFTAEAFQSDIDTLAPGFTHQQNTPIFLRIDVVPSETTYAVTFSDEGDFSNVLFTFSGLTGASRIGPDDQMNRLRIGPLDGDAPDYWNGDFATINSLTYAMIPEPSTYALGALGLAALAFLRRRKK